MKKFAYLLAGASCLLTAASAFAQLPSNPWEIKPNEGYMGDNARRYRRYPRSGL